MKFKLIRNSPIYSDTKGIQTLLQCHDPTIKSKYSKGKRPKKNKKRK